MRSIAVTVWNGASAGTLNLLCRMIGASPVCLKETVTLPSFTTSTDIFAPAEDDFERWRAVFTHAHTHTRPSNPRVCFVG